MPRSNSVVEGTGGVTVVDLELELTTSSAMTIRVDWATIDTLSQPEPGLDYIAASGTVTFLPGETVKTVPITVIGDAVDEPGSLFGAEWGAIRLTDPSNATVGSGFLEDVGFFLIADDD